LFLSKRKILCNNNNSIKFFIYFRAELNSQWPVTESARIETIRQHGTKQTKNNKTKMDQLRLFKLKQNLLKIFVDVRTAYVSDTHLAEGQWLKEQLNVVKLRMFRVGTRMPTVSRAVGQYLVPLKAFIKNSASK
jgi:hypothetical protein